MKKLIPTVTAPVLTASLPANAPRLVYAAPKLGVIGDLAKISRVPVGKAFFFRTIT